MLTNSDVNMVCSKRSRLLYQINKNALNGRFFVYILLCFFSCQNSANSGHLSDNKTNTQCITSDYDEEVAVKYVIDGDTVILDDDRHVRLIGINTPEIGHDGKASQPGAETARKFLTDLLKSDQQIRIKYDAEKKDRYRRTLAHLFLSDGTSIQSLILQNGLATTLTIPPDLEFLPCYQSSEAFAVAAGKGLWSLKQYQAISAANIENGLTGYHIISGIVDYIGESKSAVWINMGPNFVVKIKREDLSYFDAGVFDKLVGKTLIARGWLHHFDNKYRIQVRHPVDLYLAPDIETETIQ